MADSHDVAFGRYLKTLRERRGLSLNQVEALTQASPEPVRKPYLSRCENGGRSLSFLKMVTLCWAYDVAADVLAERMRLDLDLEHVGGPRTEGLSFEDLSERGKSAVVNSRYLDGYAYSRDAERLALEEQISSASDPDDRLAAVTGNLCIAAGRLGAYRLTLHELDHLRRSELLSVEMSGKVDVQFASRLQEMGKHDRALEFCRSAVEKARASGSITLEAYSSVVMSILLADDGKIDDAIQIARAACALYKKLDLHVEHARTQLNIADLHFKLGRRDAGRRALAAADRLIARHGSDRLRARAHILRGDIAKSVGRKKLAARWWRESIEISRKTKDRLSWFQAEVRLLEHALEIGDEGAAGSLRRLMRRRMAWVPTSHPDLATYKKLLARK